MALPGGTLVVLADLGHLSVTVYLPEDRYGEVKLGDAASVTVDSFPGQIFRGTVQHIADQAEFTPRNVQTPAGRRTTVFAVKLAVDNPEGKLKPGMPADVVFGQMSELGARSARPAHDASAPHGPWTASAWRLGPARPTGWSGRMARARPRPCACWLGS